MSKLTIGLGFHTGEPSYADGIGEYHRKLASNGHAIFAKGADSAGHVYAVQELSKEFPDSPAYGVYRRTEFDFLGGSTDVPNYGADVVEHARLYWQEITDNWPKELDKEFVWVEFPNEVDKNQSAWLGRLLVEVGKQGLTLGYKYCGPAWSGGEPELEDWYDFEGYLRLCEEYPDRLAISVHEYTFSKDISLSDERPWKLGRVSFLNTVCNELNIKPPTVFVTEGGWGAVDAPDASNAVPQLMAQMTWYLLNTPNVKGFAIWALDKGDLWGSKLSKIVNSYMTPLAESINRIDWTVPDPVPPDPVPPDERVKKVVMLFPQEGTRAQYDYVTNMAWDEYRRTVTSSADDATDMVLAGNKESYIIVFDPQHESQKKAIARLEELNITYQVRFTEEPTSTSPLDGLKLGHIFRYRYVQSGGYAGKFNAPRNYSNGLHEGVDFDILGGQSDNKASVLATYDGVVIEAESRPSGYGKTVLISHMNNGKEFFTRYAHMDALYVSAGDRVMQGNEIGELGSTGNSSAEHVHFNLMVPGYGLSGYYEPDVVDPEPYFSSALDLPIWAPAIQNIDILSYMLPEEEFGRMYEVCHENGATETFQVQRGATENGITTFYFVKNSQYETLHAYQENGTWYIARSLDTSPGEAPWYAERPGVYRVYTQREEGKKFSRWSKRYMHPGEVFNGFGHLVQFYYKDDCSKSSANSGGATNKVTFAGKHDRMAFNGIELEDVIELNAGAETHFFAKGYGPVAWRAEDSVVVGTSGSMICEIHDGRENLSRERGCWTDL